MKGSQTRWAKGFTLVEILIVVVLLGVIAGVVIPSVGRSTTNARETTLAMNLSLLRRFIPVYTSHHVDVPPGYPNGDRSAAPTEEAFVEQATMSSTTGGQTAPRGTANYKWGPYISDIPANPFNKLDTLLMLADGEEFPAVADDQYGWIFKAATGEIRPGNSGTNDSGTAYYNY
jgi:prepilin-type N-terminal cleavage/methylation domain-containing protein